MIKSNFELVSEVVNKEIKGMGMFVNESGSGDSYFLGKERMLKVLKNKKMFKLEINVKLSKEVEKEFNLDFLSKDECKRKKLGSMKYYWIGMDIKIMEKIINVIVNEFLKDNEKFKELKKIELEKKDKKIKKVG